MKVINGKLESNLFTMLKYHRILEGYIFYSASLVDTFCRNLAMERTKCTGELKAMIVDPSITLNAMVVDGSKTLLQKIQSRS